MNKRDKLDKKAVSGKYIMLWIIRFIILAIVVFAIVMLFRMLIINDMNVNEMKKEVFYSRLVYSANALSYVDPDTGRAYPGIIDMDKFDTTNVKSAMDYSHLGYISAKLSLLDKDDRILKGPIFYNEQWYRRWLPVSDRSLVGLGSADRNRIKIPVLYEEGGNFKQAILEADIIQPSS